MKHYFQNVINLISSYLKCSPDQTAAYQEHAIQQTRIGKHLNDKACENLSSLYSLVKGMSHREMCFV